MTADGELFEYWCHEASLLPIDMLAAAALEGGSGWTRPGAASARSGASEPGYVETVLDEVRERGSR